MKWRSDEFDASLKRIVYFGLDNCIGANECMEVCPVNRLDINQHELDSVLVSGHWTERVETFVTECIQCGDCTETYDPLTRRWHTTRVWYDSARQGRTAGASMIGSENTYQKSASFNCSYIYNELYSLIGSPHGEGTVYVYKDIPVYRKFRLVGGKLIGAMLINNRKSTTPILHSIGVDLSEYGEELAHPDFDWNTQTGEDWDYRFF